MQIVSNIQFCLNVSDRTFPIVNAFLSRVCLIFATFLTPDRLILHVQKHSNDEMLMWLMYAANNKSAAGACRAFIRSVFRGYPSRRRAITCA